MSGDLTHDELVRELPNLEKLSNAARQKLAKKRRTKQLKKYQEWLRLQRQTSVGGGSVLKKRCEAKIKLEREAVLNDMIARNDIIGAQKTLQAGADPNVSNADGLTLLHKCCIDDALELAEILVESKADTNARDVEGWTPLHAAAATGNVQMINMLIDEGASLVAINHNDKMPIDESADSDIRYVLQQKMIEAGYTDDVLGYIRESVAKTMLADLKDSVKNNRSLNVQDKYGASALHVAAANGYIEVLDFLFAQDGLNLDIQDNEGWTPFHAAVCWGQREAMKMLAQKGADMDCKDLHGDTAYAIADDVDIREYILELKGQYGESHEVELEKPDEMTGHKQRRMSVKRISQQAKEELAKQSVQEEAMLRRVSIADAEKVRGQMSPTDETKMMKEMGAMDEDDDNAVLLSAVELREESTLPSVNEDVPTRKKSHSTSSNSDHGHDGDKDSTSSNEKTHVDPFEIEEQSSRPQRPTILKRSNHPIRVTKTYSSTVSPPTSPTGSASSPSNYEQQKCCTIL